MIYKKKVKTRLDNCNGLVIRIPKAVVDILQLTSHQELTVEVQNDLKSFVVKVKG